MKAIKASLITVALLIGVVASAQDKPLTFGVKAGMNMSNVSGDFEDSKLKVGFNVGVTADYALTPDFYLLTGLEFTTKGSKVDDNTNLKLNLSYLQLPIHAGYKITVSNDTRILFHAGPYLAYAVDGKWKVKEGGSEVSVGAFSDDAEAGGIKMKRFDFGLGFGVGAEFGKINAGVNCDFGLVNISDFGIFDMDEWGQFDGSDVSVKNMNVSISLGYKF
ncbi:MAG: porin family protein [Dysgonomonas sp.]